ncbi:GNAT family N-acetyltransferase [Caulobacter sp. KR2-114]|uniref:GNAT family N-acetyltransferase n=1 Tax=Caulobacter sp. KR2-114 TaxID=3400912 RepID=UPI003C09F4B0
MSLVIDRFRPADALNVVNVIVPIQRDEYGIAITAEDQPDLAQIPDFYQTGAGGFWVARDGDQLVGTIGLKDIGGGNAALRKMFVLASHRGREHGVAARLLAALLDHARAQGLIGVWLGTTDKFLAAHRFYEKHGFREVAKAELPPGFLFMPVDTKFYALDLRGPA